MVNTNPMFFPGVMPLGNTSVSVWDAINAQQNADGNRDGKTTKAELQEKFSNLQTQLFNTYGQMSQMSQYKSYVDQLNVYFGGMYSGYIQQLQGQLDSLSQQQQSLGQTLQGMSFISQNFDKLSAADKSGPYAQYPNGDAATLSQDDLIIAAWRDGNGVEISSQDVTPGVATGTNPQLSRGMMLEPES